MPRVVELLEPASIVDVGCGIGAWLAVFADHGVTDVVGVDGDYIDRSLLEIPAELFVAHDLRQPLRLDRRFDLVVCLEVAEHLPAESGPTLVDSLTSLGDAVLFSAAIPHQPGVDHQNGRWQHEWAAIFASRNYTATDPIRPAVWDDPSVDWWYRQNTILYLDSEIAARLGLSPAAMLTVVHPQLYEQYAGRQSRYLRLRGALKARFARLHR